MANAAYHVIGESMSTDTRLNQAGNNIEDVHVIPYQIDSGPAKGAVRHVKVPHGSQYTPENVKAAIEDDVNTAHAIASLKST